MLLNKTKNVFTDHPKSITESTTHDFLKLQCQEEGCDEVFTVGKNRCKSHRKTLCKKHRNIYYKKNHTKKQQEIAQQNWVSIFFEHMILLTWKCSSAVFPDNIKLYYQVMSVFFSKLDMFEWMVGLIQNFGDPKLDTPGNTSTPPLHIGFLSKLAKKVNYWLV